MSLLLDTQVFLRFETGSAKLSRRARTLIEDANRAAYVSAASFWEIAIKRRLGKLQFEGSARSAAAAAGLSGTRHRLRGRGTAGALDWDHRDPFDRILVAHCLNRDLTLVTADARLRLRGDVPVFWAG